MDTNRILLIEDNLDAQLLIGAFLEQQGFTVVAVNNGATALAHTFDHTLSVILSDIHMTPIDGYEVIGTLRSRLVTIPAIAMTADYSAGIHKKCLDAGFNAVCQKPIDFPILLNTIAKLLAKTVPKGNYNLWPKAELDHQSSKK
jgi:two-component system, NarL family, capsular synthesis sensor histidine kinase RcsC